MSNFKNKINKQKKGIWRYVNFYDEFIKPENRLSLKGNLSVNEGDIRERYSEGDIHHPEGDIRECRLRDGVIKYNLPNINHLYFKREDQNPTGSLKGRSLAYQVSLAKQNNKKELVISTSGNAGIAAAAYCQKAGIKLYVFISPETEKAKIAEMRKYDPIIIKSKKAIRLANYLSAKYKIENLRPSANDSSIEGFKSIAFEIFEELGEIDALFAFVTSGSSFVGIGRAYKYLLENREIKKMPKLYAVQGGEIFSVAGELNKVTGFHLAGDIRECRRQGKNNHNEDDTTSCLLQAGKLGIKNTRRKNEIIELIKLSGGSGIYINDNEIKNAKNILEKNNIYTSLEGCASFAGAARASEKNKFNKVVCILSGKLRTSAVETDESKIYKAESFGEVDEIVSSI